MILIVKYQKCGSEYCGEGGSFTITIYTSIKVGYSIKCGGVDDYTKKYDVSSYHNMRDHVQSSRNLFLPSRLFSYMSLNTKMCGKVLN